MYFNVSGVRLTSFAIQQRYACKTGHRIIIDTAPQNLLRPQNWALFKQSRQLRLEQRQLPIYTDNIVETGDMKPNAVEWYWKGIQLLGNMSLAKKMPGFCQMQEQAGIKQLSITITSAHLMIKPQWKTQLWLFLALKKRTFKIFPWGK